jgi:4-hydroxy-2-oxoheptanedioate aldolase
MSITSALATQDASEPLWGIWSNYADPRVIGSLASSGVPWICIDEQHGYPPDDLAASVAAGASHNTDVLVRVAWNRSELIGRALDAGARGVIVPMIQDAAEAEAAARSTRYPPFGSRSFGPGRRAFGIDTGYGVPSPGAGPLCLVMIESADALANVDAIAATHGVDGIFVGPFDLSLALGISLEELLSDRSESAPLSRIVAACRRAGIIASGYAGATQRAGVLASHGLQLIAATTDDTILREGYTRLQHELTGTPPR